MCTENQHAEMGGNSGNNHVLWDYAWKWFEYHAKQRVSMFNFFLIASGVLAHAYVNLICEKCFGLAMGLAAIGTIISGSFLILDLRNAQLVYWGEDIMRRLERDSLFQDSFKGLNTKGQQTSKGILLRDLSCKERKWTKHWFWLRVIEGAIIVCFIIAIWYAFRMYVDP